MLASFSEFKFYQSFRITVENADEIRFLAEKNDPITNTPEYIDDARLVDISITGLGFATSQRLSVGQELQLSLQFKKIHVDISAKVVRAFTSVADENGIIYGLEFDDEEEIKKFLETYIHNFSPERLKNCLIESALRERYASSSEGFEMISLLLSLFKDLTNFAGRERFVDELLEEVTRIMNAQKAALFLINPDSNELEAISSIGLDKNLLKFDYRQGVAGSVFTTGNSLNIDLDHSKGETFDHLESITGVKTKSIISNPVSNGEDKTIGVLQIINKRNEDRFTVEDEKTMKVLSLVFSSLFHSYNPISERSQIRKFSTPFDRKHVLIGRSPIASKIRSSILKLKDLDAPTHLFGEAGTGKTLLAQIIHFEGKRGLGKFDTVHCGDYTKEQFAQSFLIGDGLKERFEQCEGGTLFFHEVHLIDQDQQALFYQRLLDLEQLPSPGLKPKTRLITSSTKDLGELVSDGSFNRDLHHHLTQAYAYIEPLRRRKGDIKDLVEYFLKAECKRHGLLMKSFSPQALQSFQDYDWPGNILELKTCVERAVLYNPKAHIIGDFSNSATPLFDKTRSALKMFDDIPFATDSSIALKDRVILVERKMIDAEIKKHNNNKSKAAKAMGMSREALRKKMLQSDQMMDKLSRKRSAEKKAA